MMAPSIAGIVDDLAKLADAPTHPLDHYVTFPEVARRRQSP